MGRALLWNFNPQPLMGGAPCRAGGDLLVVVTGSAGELGISLRQALLLAYVRDCSFPRLQVDTMGEMSVPIVFCVSITSNAGEGISLPFKSAVAT